MGIRGSQLGGVSVNTARLPIRTPDELYSKLRTKIGQSFKSKPSFPAAVSQTKLRLSVLTLIACQK